MGNTQGDLGKRLRQKLTRKHLQKVIKDDFQVLRDFGPKEFLLRWIKRMKKMPPLGLLFTLVLKKILGILPSFFRRKLLESRLKRKRILIEGIHVVDKDVVEPLSATLSVVINTKNSPPFFREIIEKYTHQVGFKKVEVVIVDSGEKQKSKDNN